MRSGISSPCCHCGCTSTCCWRKGPPEKPNLCNACGSRWLVKHNLDGYFPGSKPQRRSGSAADSKAAQRKAKAMDLGFIPPARKRQIRRKKRPAEWSDDDLTDFYPSERSGYSGGTTIRRTKIIHKHTSGMVTVDRGTQTSSRGNSVNLGTAKFFAVADYQEMSEADFNSLAVATLTLLRNSPEALDEKKLDTPLVKARRPRKPGHAAIIRTLF